MDSSASDEEVEATSAHNPSRIFSEEVHQTLNSLYARGMTGWGKKHSMCLNIARERTGLTLSQIKVRLLI